MIVTMNSPVNQLICTVEDKKAETATDVMRLVLQSMLGVSYQKESVIDAMMTVVEENTDEPCVYDKKRSTFWS